MMNNCRITNETWLISTSNSSLWTWKTLMNVSCSTPISRKLFFNLSNHFVKQYKLHRCQKPHDTLLHMDSTPVNSTPMSVTSQTMNPAAPTFTPQTTSTPQNDSQNDVVGSNTAIQLKSNSLVMTCHMLVGAPDGTSV